jgi:hypothetical protein
MHIKTTDKNGLFCCPCRQTGFLIFLFWVLHIAMAVQVAYSACSVLCASLKCSLYFSQWCSWNTEYNVLPPAWFNYAGIWWILDLLYLTNFPKAILTSKHLCSGSNISAMHLSIYQISLKPPKFNSWLKQYFQLCKVLWDSANILLYLSFTK